MAQAKYSPSSNNKKIHITGGIRQDMRALGQFCWGSTFTPSGQWNHPCLKGLKWRNIKKKLKRAGPINMNAVSSLFHKWSHGHEKWWSIKASNPINKRLNGKELKTTDVFRNSCSFFKRSCGNGILWGKFDDVSLVDASLVVCSPVHNVWWTDPL